MEERHTMKITLGKNEVQNIHKAMRGVVPRRSGLPVLKHVRFSAEPDGAVSVTGTDLEQTLTMKIAPRALDRSGNGTDSFLFPASELLELKKTMKKADVVALETAGEETVCLSVSTPAGDLSRAVPVMPVDEFPEDPADMPLEECDLEAFMSAFRTVAFSAGTSDSRPALTGVFLHAGKNSLVATDGRRMTVRKLENIPVSNDAILPANVAAMSPGLGETGRLGLVFKDDNGTLEIRTDTMRYVTRCIPGTYPNYEQVAPKDLSDYRAAFHFMDADVDALKTVLPHLKGDSDRSVFLAGRENAAAVGMESGDDGCCAIALPACRFDGPEAMTVCVNGKLLAEALDHGFRCMKVSDARTPLYFRDDNGGTHLLMPLRYDVPETLDLEFGKVFDSLPEAVKTPEPEAKPTIPESKPETPTKPEPQTENKTMTEQTKTTPNDHGMTVVESTDPVEQLEALANTAVEAVKEANTAVRDLKKQVRAVKTHYRNRDKEIAGREKDMEKNLTLINRLQESLAA
jgi:DNA polymerase III sliding clamp (beta) subunit (PCNA family)